MRNRSKFDEYVIELSEKQFLTGYLPSSGAAAQPAITEEFDASQKQAFDRMTALELAIIQGPPGTGKTFTSVGALQSLVATFSKVDSPIPIIVAAETNHALDQLLSACMRRFEVNIVRLGGRSEDEDVAQNSLFNLRSKSTAAHTDGRMKTKRDNLRQKIAECLSLCFPVNGYIPAKALLDGGVITQNQYSSLVGGCLNEDRNPMDYWLLGDIETDATTKSTLPQDIEEGGGSEGNVNKFKSLGHIADEENDEERNKLEGPFVPTGLYKAKSTGRRPGSMGATRFSLMATYLTKHGDLYEVKPQSRDQLYRYMRHQLIEKTTPKFRSLILAYQKSCDEMKALRSKNNVKVIRKEGVQIVGCTTTGLTKYRGLIVDLKPKVLLVEEAAEAIEAKITSALYPSLDQLILVGDHQQLVPQVSVQELGLEPYNFNMSLFERLVNARLPYSMLNTQRRMIPALREVVQTFYPDIVDHQSVRDPEQRAPVPGMDGINHWWFDHNFPDYRTSTMSRSNLDEARMIVGFTKYLVHNGIMPSQITILSYYKAQLDLIERELVRVFPGRGASQAVRTVDGFQGEQNDIILLSLVRSCSASERISPGFVENENRAVVALSRAKRGMFVFGCKTILNNSAASQETWGKVLDVFNEQQRVGRSIPLTCANHKTISHIQHPDDWDKQALSGGCDRRCQGNCAEGHSCTMMCHPADSGCKCERACEQRLPCGHRCESRCGEPCRCSAKACNTQAPLKNGSHGGAANQASRSLSTEGKAWAKEVQKKDQAQVRNRRAQPRSRPRKLMHIVTYTPTTVDSQGARIEGRPAVTRTSEVEQVIDRSEAPVDLIDLSEDTEHGTEVSSEGPVAFIDLSQDTENDIEVPSSSPVALIDLSEDSEHEVVGFNPAQMSGPLLVDGRSEASQEIPGDLLS